MKATEQGRRRVQLVVRADCHLCETALAVARRVVGDDVDVIDIADVGPERYAEWTDQVPVLLVDDRVLGYWTVDPARLRKALAAEKGRWRPW